MPECSEPNGNEMVHGTGKTAHIIMLEENGHCPWCGITMRQIGRDFLMKMISDLLYRKEVASA